MMPTIRDAVAKYSMRGMDTLPLFAGSKKPCSSAWPCLNPSEMWRNAPEDANVGIRCGGSSNIANIDCDDKNHVGTFDNAQNWLKGLGYQPGDYPVVQSASIVGRHIYVTFSGGLSGNYRNLSSNFGTGEFRYGSGAYVVAPPSVIDNGGVYVLLAGDFNQLPLLDQNDILPILKNKVTSTYPEIDTPKIPKRAMALLNGLDVDKFHSRSEAEQSIIVSLINVGHPFESVRVLFQQHTAAGKYSEMYSENQNKADRWLHRSYIAGEKFARSNESHERQLAQNVITWAQSSPWQGRTGAVDRGIYIAHAQIAHRVGHLYYAASARELAERAGVTNPTASKATHRLCTDYGLLELKRTGTYKYASQYYLVEGRQTLPLPHSGVLRKCKGLSNHDVFRYRGLGKSAALVYGALLEAPLTSKELSERTGKSIKTVNRSLKRMSWVIDSVTGEVIQMVILDGDKWYAQEVDLDLIAQIIGTSGYGMRQREKHAQERKFHHQALRFRGKTE